MLRWLRKDLRTIIVALVASAVTAAAPVIADTISNADTVDFKHAVGAGASVEARAGKLVATNAQGRLPNNIIAKAPDADLLDGINSTQLRSVPIDVFGAWAGDSATHTASGITLPGNASGLINTSFVYPPDRVPGRRVALELIVRDGFPPACTMYVEGFGYIGPTTEDMTAGTWEAAGDGPAHVFTLPSGITTTRLTFLWSNPGAAQAGMVHQVSLIRSPGEEADTCESVDVWGARVLY